MIDLNITSIFYIAYRLAPFIIVCFFSFSSIFNQDLKGFMYLCGLLVTTFICIVIGNTFNTFKNSFNDDNDIFEKTTKVCNLLTLTKHGPISNLPLSMVVFSYTFGYLLYIIVQYNLVIQNSATISIFVILIVCDFIWNYNNKCAKPFSSLTALIISGCLGVAYSAFIDYIKLIDLHYFNILSGQEICYKPKRQLFKCSTS